MGHGRAADIRLETGQVMPGNGSFALSDMRMPSLYHPDAK